MNLLFLFDTLFYLIFIISLLAVRGKLNAVLLALLKITMILSLIWSIITTILHLNHLNLVQLLNFWIILIHILLIFLITLIICFNSLLLHGHILLLHMLPCHIRHVDILRGTISAWIRSVSTLNMLLSIQNCHWILLHFDWIAIIILFI